MRIKFTQYIPIVLLLIIVFNSKDIVAQSGSIVTPVNNQVLLSKSVSISWNTADNASQYRAQISSDSLFTNIISDTIVFSNNFIKTFESKRYFIRVKYFTPSDSSNWINQSTFTITNPTENNSLKAWFSPDSIEVTAGKISKLFDISGHGYDAFQSTASAQPIQITSTQLNNSKLIQFDGNDLLNTPSFNINTVDILMFAKGNNLANKYFGFGNGYYVNFTNTIRPILYLAGSTYRYFTPFQSTNIFQIHNFGFADGNAASNTTYLRLNNIQIDNSSGIDGSGFVLNNLLIGSSELNGFIGDIFVFDNKQTDSIRTLYHNLLFQKYAPLVSLGYDIKIPYGFCDTTLYAGTRFSNFLWNTGETTENIKVNKSGKYWVRTTDVFGFQSSDTVMVSYTAIPQILSDTTLCQYDTAKINLNIGSPYTYSWSNGQTTANFTTNTPGEFRLLITDSAGCNYRDTFNVVIDSLPTKLWLGNDTSICLGNPLGYQLLNYTPIDGLSVGYRYIWSTGDTTVTTPINMTNNYALQLTNLRGCSAHDTVMVTLQGIPPTTQFVLSADSICSGDSVIFTDLTTGAISRSWTIGEGAPQTDSTFSYTYNTPGLFNISLTTSAANGCPRTVIKTFRVNPSPMLNFTTEPACTGFPTQFTNSSLSGANDSIVQTLWNFNDPTSGVNNNSNLTNPTHQFTTAGGYNPQLIVITRKGCSKNITKPFSVVASAALPLPFTLVYPTPDALLTDSSILFKWNESTNGYYYTLQIASDISFSNIIHTSLPLKNNSLLYRFTNFGTYYWKVTVQNICGNTTQSAVQKLELFSPKQITGMQAWFNPDYGITHVNGKITQWNDISGLNRSASQSDTAKSPKLILNAFNGHSDIQYDGINDALIIQDSLNINSTSLLSNWNGTNSTFTGYTTLLSCNNPIAGQIFLISDAGTSNFFSGCYLFNSMFINKIKSVNYSPLSQYKIVSGFKPTSISYAGTKTLRIGNDLSYAPWKGYIPEIILYNNPAMDSITLAKLTDYFYAKYAPPVSLGYDIKIPYKLCDTVISAQANHFTNYLWSTGDTTPTIHVNHSGTYWVRTTNIFGQLSSDTVAVYFAGRRTLPDTTICLGESYQYQWTPLTHYTLSWSNGNSGSTFTESQGGSYIAILTDTLGCSYKDTFNLFVDSLALRMSLGNDTSYCSGNTLNYQLNNYTLTNPQFSWSTGSTSATALVDSTHAYWLQITNPRGCVARDTVLINVRGKAPVVSFTAPGKCLGETTPFSDLSYTTDGSNLVSWQWNFGDGNNSTSQNPTHNYALPGIYPISLTVTSDSVCSNSITIPTVVYSLPSANFSPITGCNNTPIQFNDQSQTFDGYTLNYFTWNFGDIQSGGNNQSNAQSPAHQFDTSGVYLVKLKIESNVGCTDSISKIITIKKAPQANFIYSNTCEGQTTWFSDSTITETWNPITARLWLFDDGNSSTNISTLKKYDESGNYPVSYIIQTLNGCADTVEKTVSVYNIPTADFTSNSICKNEPVILESSSIVQNDIISYVRWKIATDRVYTGSPVQLYIDSAATYPVELIVKTPHECGDTITKNIIIKPIPQSQFTYQYDEQSIGYNIQFINTSIGGSTYEWQGPTGTFSTLQNPVYDFVASGTYPILLVTTNNVSCSDSATSNILVSSPIMDIAVSDLKITSVGNYQQAQVNLINISNRNITDLWITLQLNNQQIRERYSGMIRPGEITPFHFNTQIFIPNGETLEFGCVRIESPLFTQETTLDNNQVCITLGEEYSVVKLFPNPASDLIQLWLSSPNESTSNIRVLTTKGSEVITWNNQTLLKGITQLKLPLTELSNGLYILEVEFNNKIERMKFNIIR